MRHVLVVGGNHGLGLEWVKFFLKRNYKVTATYRDAAASEGLFALRPNVDVIPCDVTNLDDIHALIHQVKDLDLIIYNAGTKGYDRKFIKPLENTTAELQRALAVNVIGLDAICRAKSAQGLPPHFAFVYMSTGVSSTADNTGGGYHPYRASKQAGNAIVRNWDIDATEKWITAGKSENDRPVFFALTPGLVDVGMGAGVAGAMEPEIALERMMAMIDHVVTTKDTHALWTYSFKKLEEYKIPNAITAQAAFRQGMQSAPVLTAYSPAMAPVPSGSSPAMLAAAAASPKPMSP